jgi:hypothetical protein
VLTKPARRSVAEDPGRLAAAPLAVRRYRVVDGRRYRRLHRSACKRANTHLGFPRQQQLEKLKQPTAKRPCAARRAARRMAFAARGLSEPPTQD